MANWASPAAAVFCLVLVLTTGMQPVAACKADGSTACAQDPTCCKAGTRCFEKDEYWSACFNDCLPGIHPDDPPSFQTAWSCTMLPATLPVTPGTTGTTNSQVGSWHEPRVVCHVSEATTALCR